jgi:hypothetical protein
VGIHNVGGNWKKMKNKISTVKNPLTVIAIFAGTAEISGTAILPLLEAQSQQTYIWFLMLFPLILIVFFFLTLNWNHKVLYAPSDFANEDNFVNILKKPTIQETISKIEEGLEEGSDENDDSETVSTSENGSESDSPDKSIISTKENRNKDATHVRNIQQQIMQETQLAELLVLNKLEQELKSPIQREMMMKIGNTQVIFDGVVQVGSYLTGIEVKYMRRRNAFNSSMWRNMTDKFERLYQSLSDSQKKQFSIIFAVVTDESADDIQPQLENRMRDLSFPVQIRIYDFDQLRNESVHK